MNRDLIIAWLKQFLTVGGPSAVIAYGLFRYLGTKWLETKLATHVEKLKHDQQKEIEQVRHKIQRMFSRISKIHEKEFEILPKAWFMLHDAYGAASQVVALLRFVPDFKSMDDEAFEEFLTRSRLSPYHQNKLRAASDRPAYYREANELVELDVAEEKRRAFNNYLIENRIFMTAELRDKFGDVAKDLIEGLNSFDVGRQAKDMSLRREGIKQIGSLAPKIEEVERAVQKRLHYDEA
jgi:hypothetical protein